MPFLRAFSSTLWAIYAVMPGFGFSLDVAPKKEKDAETLLGFRVCWLCCTPSARDKAHITNK